MLSFREADETRIRILEYVEFAEDGYIDMACVRYVNIITLEANLILKLN